MQAEIEHLQGVPVVSISGRLDTITAPLFDAELAPSLLLVRAPILLDLTAVTFISSAGLRSILRLIEHTAAHGGRLGLVSVPGHVLEVIEISGLSSRIDIYPDRASALQGCIA
jgi:anti-anti-sigma factor